MGASARREGKGAEGRSAGGLSVGHERVGDAFLSEHDLKDLWDVQDVVYPVNHLILKILFKRVGRVRGVGSLTPAPTPGCRTLSGGARASNTTTPRG